MLLWFIGFATQFTNLPKSDVISKHIATLDGKIQDAPVGYGRL
jgi:hypothetical protein